MLTGDNPISSDEDVAVEKILLRPAVADVRFPLNLSGRDIEAAEDAITRAEVHAIARARGGVRESASGFELPEDFGLLSLGVRR
ncbi:MAG TPA: hypothetical protein VFT47_07905 [Vicinamibacterales bacterium]|nr:hypothetical protein [Vicinamibacterales bacterium]